MTCQQKRFWLRQCHSFRQSSLGSIKRLERIEQLWRPSHTSLCVPRGQHTNENVHDLSAAKQVTVWCDLLFHGVFHCFLTFHLFCWVPGPSLGARESHRIPHCSADKWKQWFFSEMTRVCVSFNPKWAVSVYLSCFSKKKIKDGKY